MRIQPRPRHPRSKMCGQRWLGERAIEAPTMWRPFKWNGSWRGPELSRRKQALLVKEAIRRGEIKLEPTVMVPPTKFKGHQRERQQPITLANVAQKMEEMPRLIAELRAARREKRLKQRAAARWK